MEYFHSHLRRPLVVERNMPLVWLVWMIDCCHIIELPSSSAEKCYDFKILNNVSFLIPWSARIVQGSQTYNFSPFFIINYVSTINNWVFSLPLSTHEICTLELYVLYRRWLFRESGGCPLVRSGQWPLSDVIGGTWGIYSVIWYGTL